MLISFIIDSGIFVMECNWSHLMVFNCLRQHEFNSIVKVSHFNNFAQSFLTFLINFWNFRRIILWLFLPDKLGIRLSNLIRNQYLNIFSVLSNGSLIFMWVNYILVWVSVMLKFSFCHVLWKLLILSVELILFVIVNLFGLSTISFIRLIIGG